MKLKPFLLFICLFFSLLVFFGFKVYRQSTSKLIDDYLNQKNIAITITNPSSQIITTNNNFSFATLKSFDQLIQKQTFSTDQQKLIWLNNYIKTTIPFSYTLHLNTPTPQSLSHLLSALGTGDCGFTANLMVILSHHLGYLAREWNLNGHAVSEVFYNKSWHLFDPRFLDYIFANHNQVASFEQVLSLAKNNQLPMFNHEFVTVEDNQIFSLRPTDFLHPQSNQILLSFFPLEKKTFFRHLYLVTHNGLYLNSQPNYQSKNFLSNYQGKIANIVREIPLNKFLPNFQDSIEIIDFFPIVGVFLLNDQPMFKKTLEIATVDDSSLRKTLPRRYLEPLKYFGKIIDYTPPAPHNFIPFRLAISNLSQTQRLYPNSKLLVVTQYAPSNTNFNNLKDISVQASLMVSSF